MADRKKGCVAIHPDLAIAIHAGLARVFGKGYPSGLVIDENF